jgi:hypothetical protein
MVLMQIQEVNMNSITTQSKYKIKCNFLYFIIFKNNSYHARRYGKSEDFAKNNELIIIFIKLIFIIAIT